MRCASAQDPAPEADADQAPRPKLPEPLDAVDAAITAEELYAHVATLASDAAGGRFTGAPETELAIDYLVSRLEALRPYGVEPAGDLDAVTGERSFLQDVDLPNVTFETLPTLHVDGAPVELGVAFRPLNGYGFEGELKLLQVDDPDALPAEPAADTALFLNMARTAARAALEERGDDYTQGWGVLIERGSRTAGRTVATPDRVYWVRGPERPVRLEVRGDGRELLTGLPDGTPLAVELGGERRKAYNVLALLPATDIPEGFVSEAIVLSAHYDHLRPIPVEEGEDGIFNGADDDASGCAAVLEIVEALAVEGAPRGRDVVALFATGEEIGLVGTTYYLDHPVVPLDRTTMNLNFEMIGRPDELAGPPGTLWLTGYTLTNLGPDLATAGLSIVDDPRPSQRFFQRSDNYAFVLKGVVGQSLSSFNLHEDYHTVDDEADRLDYEHMRIGTEVGLAATRLLLDAGFQVEWVPEYELPRR